jgi:leader peptidase (prepilin peptidase)/N-methyltransferase
MDNLMEIFIASVYGLMLGSFLNVVIYRLPKAILKDANSSLKFLLWPASSAPCCGSSLHWYENIPVFSWIYLRGKCSHCEAPISPRYILVELLTSGAFAWSAWNYGLSITGVVYALFFAIAIALFFIDLETFLLPDRLTYAMLWLGFIASAFGYLSISPRDAILGACLGYLVPWSINAMYFLMRKHDGLGGGDYKLLAALGAWLGWPDVIPVLCGASIIGLLVIGFASAVKREKLLMNQALPFGPFLLLSGLGFVIWGA